MYKLNVPTTQSYIEIRARMLCELFTSLYETTVQNKKQFSEWVRRMYALHYGIDETDMQQFAKENKINKQNKDLIFPLDPGNRKKYGTRN